MRLILLACFSICFLFFNASQAQNVPTSNWLKQLLDLPAPPSVDEEGLQVLDIRSFSRPPEFYDINRVPPDDAPIEDLIFYWSKQVEKSNLRRYNLKPSEKTVERLIEFCEENPTSLSTILNILPSNPKTAEAIKSIYDKLLQDEKKFDYPLDRTKNWLLYQSNYFADELMKKAEKVQDKDRYVVNQTELLALARVDWDRAAPILERLVNDTSQPVSATLAKWAYYAHAIATNNDADVTKYRRQLQDTVENRELSAGNRDLAMDALVTQEAWEGREDWYISLFSDETLYELERFSGLTTILRFAPPEKIIPAMAKLVESKNPAVRKAAVRNLVNYLREERIDAVRALLPWLSNPNWITDSPEGRGMLIAAVGRVDLPESIPSLIAILTNEERYRQIAAEALGKYKDSRAVPALRLALTNEKNPYRRFIFLTALNECGGLSDDEKMSGLETYAAAVATPENLVKFNNYLYGQPDESSEKQLEPIALALGIGRLVAEQTQPSDTLATRVVERLKVLRKTKPAVAASLAQIIRNWKGRIIFLERLRQIRDGEADLDTILTALAQRKQMREIVSNDIFALRSANGAAHGIAACLSEENAELLSILRQPNADAQIAMFGCARLLRAKLPVAETSAFLKNPNKMLALAAERYLESEDSPEARTIVLGQHPGEAVILGARQAFIPDVKNIFSNEPLNDIFQSVTGRRFSGEKFPNMDKIEEKLRSEIKSNPDLLAVYGILPDKLDGQQVIRVFKDKIVFTNYEDEARYREKTLTAKEYEDFYGLLINEKVDSVIPSFVYCDECYTSEFIMFGKDGGRRVFFPNVFPEESSIKKVFDRFASFNQGNLKLHYHLSDQIKGLEVLLADDKNTARAVWKNGNDLRVLVEDKDREAEIAKNLEEQFQVENSVEIDDGNFQQLQQRRMQQEKKRQESLYAHYFWRGFANGNLGEMLTQPLEMPFLIDEAQAPDTPGMNPSPRAWQVRAGNYEIRTIYSESGGIYKVARGQAPIKIKEGGYSSPIVTADENWVIVSKTGEGYGEPVNLVRINLKTGKEFPVNLPPADTFEPIAFIVSQNKVLIYRAKGNRYYNYRRNQSDDDDEESEEDPVPVKPDKNDKNPSPASPEYYLLDAATGATQLVKGEFRPLEDLTYRPLQPTSAPNEFWAAVYDKKAKETAIGRYNTNTFAFQTVTKFPGIVLDSMDIWVDEKESRIYFVYEGHLLVAPLQSQQK